MIYIPYTGPAKPIQTWHRPKIDYFEAVVFLSGFIAVGLDVFYWRANMPLF